MTAPRPYAATPGGPTLFLGLWAAARRHLALLLGIPFIVGVLTIVAVLVVPRRYQATVSFKYESGGGMELPSAVAGLVSQLNLGGLQSGESPQFYADLVTSRPILDSLLALRPQATCDMPGDASYLEMLDLGGRSLADSQYRARKRLSDRIDTDVNLRTGVIRAAVEAECPALAVELADSLVAALNAFNVGTRQSTAHEKRVFAEERVAEADSMLRRAEDAQEAFLKRNRQFSSPELQFQNARLERQVDQWQDIATALRRQYENARLEEVNSTPVITVIEPPATPVRPSWPKRRLIVIGATLFAGLVGLAAAVGRTLMAPLPSDASPALRAFYHWARPASRA